MYSLLPNKDLINIFLRAKYHLPTPMFTLPLKIPSCYVHVISLPALIVPHHSADASVHQRSQRKGLEGVSPLTDSLLLKKYLHFVIFH